jgi:hypothetical protein
MFPLGMFGWHENSEIADVLGIEIANVQLNTNMLFQNNENNCCSAILRRR